MVNLPIPFLFFFPLKKKISADQVGEKIPLFMDDKAYYFNAGFISGKRSGK
jgi:hypothetical protein